MSVFRIQRKRLQSDSKHKVHSQESKSYSKNVKNLTELLNSVRQKQESQIQIKKRIFTLEQNDPDSNMSKLKTIKRISETYNIKTNRKDSMRNSKISKNSLSGTKFFPVFSPGKNSDTKFHPYHGIVRSSPKLQSKLSGQLKSQQKINMSEQKISLEKKKEKGKNEYISLNSSIISRGTKNKIQSNRIVSEQKTRQFKQIYDQAMQYYRKKNSHKALLLFKQCLKYDPQNIDCLYHMGSCCLNMQNYEYTIKYLTHVKNINPTYNTNIYLYLAISHKMLKNEDQSLKILQQGVKTFSDFQQGFLYIGKIYLRHGKFDQAIKMLQQCIQINSNNVIGKVMLADACSLVNQQLRAVQILKQVLMNEPKNKLDSKTQISTHLKLIKLLLHIEKYLDPSLANSLSFLQDHTPTSPQLAYYKSLLKYQTSPEMTPKQLSQMKINLYFALNQLNTYALVVQCTKLLLKIYIDNKDFYGAEETLKRITQSEVKQEHMKEWALVIEGANDIIKRKYQEGKEKILKCIKKLNSKKNKKTTTSIFEQTSKDISYLKLHAYCFLAYSLYLQQNLSQSLSVYEQILNNNTSERTYRQTSRTKTFDQKFMKRYQQNYEEIQLNKTVIQAIIDHKVKQNFDEAKRGFQILMQKRVAPQPIFMWAINQISLLKKAQTEFSHQNQDSQSQNSQYGENHKVYQGFNWNQFFQKIQKAETISPNYSLIYFYHSLVLLYLQSNTQALKKVQTAIQKVQQPVSEYHFIEALCHYTIFEQTREIQSAFRGLEAIDKAIQIDSGIPEFYKERSKHFFCLGKYEESIKDCQKCQEESPDDEVKLLCMFYSYAACKYERSQSLLQELAGSGQQTASKTQNGLKSCKSKVEQNPLQESSLQSQNEHKYKEFEQAVKFRLKKYNQTGFMGKLLIALTDQSHPKLDKSYLKLIKDAISDRHQYSQFTVYFMNLLLSVYFMQQNDFTTCLNYLFACLEEIQCIVDQKQHKMHQNDDNQSEDPSIVPLKARMNDEIVQLNTDDMLNEIKYNIVVATMIKNRHERMVVFDSLQGHKGKQASLNVEEVYSESLTLIETFMRESHCEQLIENLQVMKSLILKSEIVTKGSDKSQKKMLKESGSIPVYLKPYPSTQKFSDQMPYLVIPIGQKYILMTKFVIFYPIKLRFNIKPEFDPSFLFNFDIDKVDNKITPPWYKFSQTQSQGQFQNRIIFTDQLRNESIAISSTQRGPSIIDHRKSKNRYDKNGSRNESDNRVKGVKYIGAEKEVDFKQMIKLDSKIQKKLKKLFPK